MRTDVQPGTGSATYCSGVSLRQLSSILSLAHRLNAYSEVKSSCMGSLLPAGTGVLCERPCRRQVSGEGGWLTFATERTSLVSCLVFGSRRGLLYDVPCHAKRI